MKSINKIAKLAAGLGCVALLACGCSHKSSNRHAAMQVVADTAGLPHYSAIRLDKELMSINPNEVEKGMQELMNKYGQLFDMYLQHGIEVGPATETAGNKEVLNKETADILRKEILSNKGYQAFFQAEDSVYANGLEKEMKEFETALQRFHSFLPKVELPKKVIAMFSCFGPKIAIGPENEMMVSMEYYIGSNFKPYKYVDGIYAYDAINLDRKMLVRDMVQGWSMNNFANNRENGIRLLDEMMYQGKMMYLLEACLPGMNREDLMGYTADQWEWCEKNERNMWTSVKESKHIYSFDRLTISKYVNPAPHTVFFPYNEADDNTPESPGKAGIWLGWRIVDSYMKNNAEVSMEQLMQLTDSQQLLEDSGYNPK